MHPLATRWYEHDDPLILSTVAELDRMLDTLPRAPAGYNIARLWVNEERYQGLPATSTHSMRLGVTGDSGGISYRDRRTGLGYRSGIWFSVGDLDAPGDVEYWGGVDAQYFYPASSVVGLEVIRAAVHEFAETGRRPTCVTWQPWRPPLVETEPAGDNWF